MSVLVQITTLQTTTNLNFGINIERLGVRDNIQGSLPYEVLIDVRNCISNPVLVLNKWKTDSSIYQEIVTLSDV